MHAPAVLELAILKSPSQPRIDSFLNAHASPALCSTSVSPECHEKIAATLADRAQLREDPY